MGGLSRHRKAITVTLTLASAAVLVSFALTYSKTVSHPLLGSDWRCSRTAFLTSCTPITSSFPRSISPTSGSGVEPNSVESATKRVPL